MTWTWEDKERVNESVSLISLSALFFPLFWYCILYQDCGKFNMSLIFPFSSVLTTFTSPLLSTTINIRCSYPFEGLVSSLLWSILPPIISIDEAVPSLNITKSWCQTATVDRRMLFNKPHSPLTFFFLCCFNKWPLTSPIQNITLTPCLRLTCSNKVTKMH